MFGDGDRRDEPDRAHFRPAMPFFPGPIVIADGGSPGVGHAEVVRFVQSKAKGLEEGFVAFVGTCQPLAEAGEGRAGDAEVGRTPDALRIADAGGQRGFGPDRRSDRRGCVGLAGHAGAAREGEHAAGQERQPGKEGQGDRPRPRARGAWAGLAAAQPGLASDHHHECSEYSFEADKEQMLLPFLLVEVQLVVVIVPHIQGGAANHVTERRAESRQNLLRTQPAAVGDPGVGVQAKAAGQGAR